MIYTVIILVLVVVSLAAVAAMLVVTAAPVPALTWVCRKLGCFPLTGGEIAALTGYGPHSEDAGAAAAETAGGWAQDRLEDYVPPPHTPAWEGPEYKRVPFPSWEAIEAETAQIRGRA